MMDYKKDVGKFLVESQTGGIPHWTRIVYEKRGIISGIHHDDIPDLIYALQRLLEHIKEEAK